MGATLERVCVVGSGSWGTAAAGLVAPRVKQVGLWARRGEVAKAINSEHRNPAHLVDYQIPGNVFSSSELGEVARGAEAIVLAVPSDFLRTTCRQLAPIVEPDVPLLVLTKGIERGTCMLLADVVGEELGARGRVAVLSGPNHAEEICQGKLSAAVIASEDASVAELFRTVFVSPSFRAYASEDLVGVEVCGAIKNVIAIACGIAAGLEAGDNTLAVLMTRGIAEIGRFVSALGGDPLTCMGLAGMGDLVVTCTSRHSRNRSFGYAFASGESLADYEGRTHMVVEGARAALSAHELAERTHIEAPLCSAVHDLLYGGVSLEGAVSTLIERVPRQEFYGFA